MCAIRRDRDGECRCVLCLRELNLLQKTACKRRSFCDMKAKYYWDAGWMNKREMQIGNANADATFGRLSSCLISRSRERDQAALVAHSLFLVFRLLSPLFCALSTLIFVLCYETISLTDYTAQFQVHLRACTILSRVHREMAGPATLIETCYHKKIFHILRSKFFT